MLNFDVFVINYSLKSEEFEHTRIQHVWIFEPVTNLLDETTTNIPSFAITTNSIVLNVPLRQRTENDNNVFNQDDTSTLSTLNTTHTQQFQTPQTIPRVYDPPPPP